MTDITRLLEKPDVTIAVVGATDNPSKYGNVIYRDLKRKGFVVYPVNPNRSQVDGDQAFPHLGDLPQKPTIVNIVVPPEVTLNILEQCLSRGLTNVWLQTGSGKSGSSDVLAASRFQLPGGCLHHGGESFEGLRAQLSSSTASTAWRNTLYSSLQLGHVSK